ncbi:MAG: tetratricopeptide repeat protein [Chloroflexales bacterium]|nr:tetratricopeptide repeat protein [Chloroflexales bacterium]
MSQRTRRWTLYALRSTLYVLRSTFCILLAACSFGAAQGPPPTPTPLLAPYNAALATAEAGGDAVTRAAAYYERGSVQFDQGDYGPAIADYDQAIALDPTNARAFNNRALAQVALGRAEQALMDYDAAIALDPTYVRAIENRLRLRERRGDQRGVAQDYARLAEIEPAKRASHRYGEGVALMALQETAGARAAFDSALAANPQHVDALYERALLAYGAGQFGVAINDLSAALRLSPRATNAYYARALAHHASGDSAGAIADFTTVLELDPVNAEALLGRATLYAEQGDQARAIADLDALDQLPHDAMLAAAAMALRQQIPVQ